MSDAPENRIDLKGSHFKEESMTMKHFTAAALIAAAFALAGCNTVAGFGQDLKKGSEHVSAALGKAGDKITNKAEKTSKKTAADDEK